MPLGQMRERLKGRPETLTSMLPRVRVRSRDRFSRSGANLVAILIDREQCLECFCESHLDLCVGVLGALPFSAFSPECGQFRVLVALRLDLSLLLCFSLGPGGNILAIELLLGAHRGRFHILPLIDRRHGRGSA